MISSIFFGEIVLNSYLIYIKTIFHFALLIFCFYFWALILITRFNMGFDNCWCYAIFLWFGFALFVWLWIFFVVVYFTLA